MAMGGGVLLVGAIIAIVGIFEGDPSPPGPTFAEWAPPASHEDSLLRFRLVWNWDDDGRGLPDSFEVQVRLRRGQGNSVLLVDRRVPLQVDTFSVQYLEGGEVLSFSGSVRGFRRNSLSAPTTLNWQYPKRPDQRLPIADSGHAGVQLVEFPAVSFSPRPMRPGIPLPATDSSVKTPGRPQPDRPVDPQPEPARVPQAPLEPGGALTSCGNEPSGYEPLATHPWSDVPPKSPEKGPDGWTITARRERFRVFVDPNSPSASKRVLEGKFPQGAPGGRGPFRMDFIFRRNVSTIYMCAWMKLSDNFTNNGNAGTKFGFFLTPYEGTNKYLNHYFNLTNRLGINLQSARATLNRQMQSNFPTTRRLGEWHRIEWLVIANSSGRSDGTARMWVDGRQVLNQLDVQYFFPEQVAAFKGVSWNPTYGGGLNPVPYDLYQWVSDWYISGR